MIPTTATKSPPQSVSWGEEREDGAVYAVTLKKVRYRSSDKLFADEGEISHLQWQTLKIRKIKNGTLAKLVEHLAPCKAPLDEVDPGYLVAFLTTYRSFAKPRDVLDLLLERYRTFSQEGAAKAEVVQRVLRGVLAVLTVWLEQFPYDFSEPPNYTNLNKMLRFVEREVTEAYKNELAKKIRNRIERFKITPFEDQGDPIQFRFSMSTEVDYVVQKEMAQSVVADTGTNFLEISPAVFAEQLTLMDAELFKKVVAWHCLGYTWSRRGKDKGEHAPSVKTTVNQFNAVSLRVISTIINATTRKNGGAGLRARAITHWINIAQECRDLKNFSSLKAIVAGLQSSSIHRMRRSWSHVSRDNNALFDELSSICSEEKNQEQSRELLMKEGTAKWVEELFPRTKSGSIKKRKSRFVDLGVMQGTVPYLGTFLTDLMMLDAAYHDYTEDGLINFDKRRKEFEVIAQIKLLQESAKNYTIEPNDKFRRWFDSVETFSEEESFRISVERETESPRKTCSEKKRRSLMVVGTLRKMLSEPDISKLMLSPDSTPDAKSTSRTSRSTETSPATARRHTRQGSESSTSSGVSSGSEGGPNRTDPQPSAPVPIILSRAASSCEKHEHPVRKKSAERERLAHSLSLPRTSSPPTIICTTPPSSASGYIVRVSLDTVEDNGLVYKGIWLADDERTPTVIRTSMAKHDLVDDPSNYKLVQTLPNGGEIEIPCNANVYYALNSSAYPLTLRLVKKS